jgi:hypothetical protein
MGPDATRPSRVMELAHAFWGSKALFAAVELGVFAALADAGPQDAEALRSRLGLHPRGRATSSTRWSRSGCWTAGKMAATPTPRRPTSTSTRAGRPTWAG